MRYSVILEAYGTSPIFDSAEFQADRLTEELGMEVHAAYSHRGEPSVEETLQEIASEDPDVLVVIPFYFAPSPTTEGGTFERFGVDPKTRRGVIKLSGKDVEVRVARMFITEEEGLKEAVKAVVSKKAGKDTGIMLVGHGSRNGKNLEMMRPFGAALSSEGYDVLCGSNEFDEETVESMLLDLASRKDKVAVLPMFISPNKHSREDVPPKLGLGIGKTSGTVSVNGRRVEVEMLPEIGSCPEITGILAKTVRDAMRQYCQSCGMPLDDSIVSREPDGSVNWKYCKWCYSDGRFAYSSIEEISAFLSSFMAKEGFPPEQVKDFLETTLPSLERWRSS